MEAMYFRLAANHAAANAVPGPYGIIAVSTYDPLKPWDSVWHSVVKEETWWRKEFETPAMLIITKINSLHNSIDGDVVLSGASGSGSAASHRPSPPARAPAAQTQKGEKQKKQHGPQRSGSDGMVTNRAGRNFCSDFQNGRCSNSTSGCACPKNSSQTHQCSRCLSMGHGAYGPGQACTALSAKVRHANKGKGKGKNKR